VIDDEQLLMWFQKKFELFQNHRRLNYDDNFIENNRLYESFRDNRLQLWQTNAFLSYTFSMIQTILPRIIGYIWQGDKLVTAIPKGIEDVDHARIVDDLLSWQMNSQIPNVFTEWVEFVQVYLMQGNGIGKLTWNILKDRPEFNNIDILDFYPEPYKKHINDMDLFQAYDMPVDVLLQRSKIPGAGYQNIEKLMGTSMTTKEEQSNRRRDVEVGKIKVSEPMRPTALIYQYWGKIPVQDRIEVGIPQLGYTKYKEGMMETGNRMYITRKIIDPQTQEPMNPFSTEDDPEGFKPYISGKNYLTPNEFWGKGDIQPNRDIQYETNETFNNIMDNVKLGMNRMWLVDRNAGIDLSTLQSYPGNVVQGNNISKEGIRSLEHRDIPQSAFKVVEDMPQIMQDTVGVHDYTKGANAPGMTDTVGGITSLIEEANMRFAHKIRVLQHTAITDFAEKLYKLDKIFMKGAEIPTRLENEEGFNWQTINPDNVKGFFDFRPVPVSMIGNKLAQENTMIKLLDVLSKAPPIPPLITSILEKHDVSNVDEIMDYMMSIWGIPAQGSQGQPPQVPQPQGGGQGIPLRPTPANLPPQAVVR